MKYLAHFIIFFTKVIRRIKMKISSSLFFKIGSNVIFDPNDQFSYKTITIGQDVFIGSGAKFSSQNDVIKIGNKVMFGPNVTILGGDHNTEELGKFMFDVKNKLPHNDSPIILEDDVWIGANVIILKGVKISRGSIVGAGSLVTKSCEPYSILVGTPAKVKKMRFDPSQIEIHEKSLYKEKNR